MFEIGIFCVILFAVGYWATLFIMGRREDVLHGEFVAGEAELIPVPEAPPMPFPGVKPVSRAAAVESEPKPEPAPAATPPASRPFIAMPPANAERLQSLLVSIKQELKNASQM
jgi:hypothetical protein